MIARIPRPRTNKFAFAQKCFCALSTAFFCLSTLAQTTAPADLFGKEFLRQQEQHKQRRQAQETVVDARLQETTPADPTRLVRNEQPCFLIQKIVWNNPEPQTFAWLDEAIKGPQGDDAPVPNCLGTQSIALIIKRAQDALVAHGFVTSRVLAPAQNLSAGELALTVIPGRIGAIRLTQDSHPRATLANAMAAQAGDLLNLRDIEQGLENLQRVPTAQADIQIVPAEGPSAQPGQSDLVVAWQQGLPFRVNLTLDDSGSLATGKYQSSLTLSYDHWWTLNDLFYLTVGRDAHDAAPYGTNTQALHYSLPWGYNLLALSVNRSDYHQTVAGVTQDYVYSGTSHGYELALSRVVQRNAVGKTTLHVQGFMQESRNFIDDVQVQVQHRRVGGWALGVHHKTAWGPATLEASLNRKRGTGAFGSISAPEEAFGEGTARFELSTAEVKLNVPFTWGARKWFYSGQWRGQANHTPLTPQERFAIGGRYSVRGFDGESRLSAEQGWFLRNEIGLALGATQLYVGLDGGEVSGPSSRTLLGQRLAGGVIGWRGMLGKLQYDMFLGGPVSQPTGFKTANPVAGFTMSLSF